MLLPKYQALDIGRLLQLSPEPAEKYIGDSAGSKTFKNPVFTIRYSHFALFSDISLQHKISLVGRTMGSIAKLKRLAQVVIYVLCYHRKIGHLIV